MKAGGLPNSGAREPACFARAMGGSRAFGRGVPRSVSFDCSGQRPLPSSVFLARRGDFPHPRREDFFVRIRRRNGTAAACKAVALLSVEVRLLPDASADPGRLGTGKPSSPENCRSLKLLRVRLSHLPPNSSLPLEASHKWSVQRSAKPSGAIPCAFESHRLRLMDP